MRLFKNKKSKVLSSTEVEKTLHQNLKFTATEQYKLLRTNLSFTLPNEQDCYVIGVTSAMRGEGKSTTAINLSYVLAESGKRVLLIDGDLRLPSVAQKMQLQSSPGLTDILKGEDSIQMSNFRSKQLNNWYIMPSGELPPNPSELLGSRRMEKAVELLSENFDYIVIDLPPVNIVSDAMTASKFITGMIVVIREDYTEKREFDMCTRQLALSEVNVLGCVINESKNSKSHYGKRRYGRYGQYYYKYGSSGSYGPAGSSD